MKTNQKVIATINNKVVNIVDSDGTELVPIKPICEILGIESEAQRKKILADEILSSTTVLSMAVGADGKQREMFCLPLRYIFGWLFTINPSNVKEQTEKKLKFIWNYTKINYLCGILCFNKRLSSLNLRAFFMPSIIASALYPRVGALMRPLLVKRRITGKAKPFSLLSTHNR